MNNQEFVVKRSPGQHARLKGKGQLLHHLDIELTERCNNACMHCYINLPEHDEIVRSSELSTDQWKDVLRQAAELGALSIRFTGGEPLLRQDFAELYLFTRRLGMQVILFTNARLINPELADLFAQVPPRKKIEISVYGMHPDSYDASTCAPGAYVEFRHGIDCLLERKIPFVVKSVLLPPNRAEKAEFENWVSTLPWMDKDPSYAMFLDLRGRRDSLSKNRLISSLRTSPVEGVKMLTRNEKIYRIEMAEFCSKFIGPVGEKLFTCGAGETGCVDAYGKYQMCMLLRHPDLVCDLTKGTIRDALMKSFPRFLETKAVNPEYLERCARCFLKGLCEQCPAKSWEESGSLDTPVEYLCSVAHAQARYLGLLQENENAWEIVNWKARVSALRSASQ